MSDSPRVLVIAPARYNGLELWTALRVLRDDGLQFEVVSPSSEMVDERSGQRNAPARLVREVQPTELGADFDALMIVSGHPQDTHAFWVDKTILEFVSVAAAKDLPIAAICGAVPTVRHIAEGKRVSFFPLIKSRQLLEEAGAIPTGTACTVDGKLVTAEHPMAAQMWATAFSRILRGLDHGISLTPSAHFMKKKLRRPIREIESFKKMKTQTDFYTSPGISKESLTEFALRSRDPDKPAIIHAHRRGEDCTDSCQEI